MIALLTAVMVTLSLTGCGAKQETLDGATQSAGETAAVDETDNTGAGETSAAENNDEKELILIPHHFVVEAEGKELAHGYYDEIRLQGAYGEKYPQLQQVLTGQADDSEQFMNRELPGYGAWAQEYEVSEDVTYYSYLNSQIMRADERMFTVMDYVEEYSGGAHPNHGITASNLDPATGKAYSIKDVVIGDPEQFGKILREKLEENYPGIMEEVDSYYYGEGDVFGSKLEEDSYTWTLTEDGLQIYFSPYEIASYAAGTMAVTIANDEYPGLLNEALLVTEPQNLEERIGQGEEVRTMLEPEELIYEGSGPDMVILSNATWQPFCTDTEDHSDVKPLTLTRVKEDASDYINQVKWQEEHQFPVPSLDRYDDAYYYCGADVTQWGYDYTRLTIYDANTMNLLYDYDLSWLCNGPDDATETASDTRQYIFYAQIVEDMLYVSLGFNGYAQEEPDSNYMVAISLNTDEVVWRSEPLTSNAQNFRIVGDNIICGYGFTAEDDYLYLLNRYTGEKLDQIPLRSAPNQLEIVEDTLYVLTYNTAYEFKIQ